MSKKRKYEAGGAVDAVCGLKDKLDRFNGFLGENSVRAFNYALNAGSKIDFYFKIKGFFSFFRDKKSMKGIVDNFKEDLKKEITYIVKQGFENAGCEMGVAQKSIIISSKDRFFDVFLGLRSFNKGAGYDYDALVERVGFGLFRDKFADFMKASSGFLLAKMKEEAEKYDLRKNVKLSFDNCFSAISEFLHIIRYNSQDFCSDSEERGFEINNKTFVACALFFPFGKEINSALFDKKMGSVDAAFYYDDLEMYRKKLFLPFDNVEKARVERFLSFDGGRE